MYSSSHARAKFGLEAREHLHKRKSKSCSYYVRIVFFFTSLIQSLIIVSLVLFLIYGNPGKIAEQKKIKELEQNFNRLNGYNMKLKKDNGSLGDTVNALTAEKAALQKEVDALKTAAKVHKQAMEQKKQPPATPCPPGPVKTLPNISVVKALQSHRAEQSELMRVNNNFTRTVHNLSQERDDALKDRDRHHQVAKDLRGENAELKDQLVTYTRKCTEAFSTSLNCIQEVTKNFLDKINNLFQLQTFHLTCEKQHEQMELIRTGCTNLSRDIEDKFQMYLDRVGNKVANILLNATEMEKRIARLTSDLKQCPNKPAEASGRLQVTTK